MKVQQFPDIDLPTVNVTASLPGAAPAQLETEVARKIENSIATLQGLKHIYTKVQDGAVTITAEFRLEKPTQEAVDDVRDLPWLAACAATCPPMCATRLISKVKLGGHARCWPTPSPRTKHGRRGPELVCGRHAVTKRPS